MTKGETSHGETYVSCSDCGKKFSYDAKEMRIGKAIDHSHDDTIPPPKQLKRVFLAAVPAAIAFFLTLLGIKRRKASGD